MKVLHVITSLADGGAQAVLYHLCVNDNHDEHTVISLMAEDKYQGLLVAAGIPVHCLNMRQNRINIRGIVRLRHLLRAGDFDVVQTWMYHPDLLAGALSRLARIPVVWGIHHSTLAPGKSKRSTIIIARICALLSRIVPTRIVCCSQRAALVHRELGYTAAKIDVIPNGYDLERFSPDPGARLRGRIELGAAEEVPLFGMAARFNPQKDHQNLLTALGRIAGSGQSFRCVLIGPGIDMTNSTLVTWIEQEHLSDRVVLLGQRTDIPGIMNSLDVHVLSSAYGEAFPNVICEAMACGTPCVATDIGDAAFIIGDTGWIVPPGNPESLADALMQAVTAMRNSDAWQRRRAGARQRIVGNFSIDTMVSGYRAVWMRAIGAD